MKIKVERVNQVNKLFEVIDSCAMNVELVTGEGDCLNMKSKLSQYLSMTRMFANGDVPEMALIAKNEQDAQKLIAFLKKMQTLRNRRIHKKLKKRAAARYFS